MKRKIFTVLIMLGILLFIGGCAGVKSAKVSVSPATAKPSAAKPAALSLPVAKGSKVDYDDKIGFEEFPFIKDGNTVITIEGDIRRIFTSDPEGKSPLAMIRHYEEAIQNMGGEILYKTRTPKEEEMGGKKLTELFKTRRIDRGLGTYQFTYTAFPGGNEKEGMTEFLSAVVKKGTAEMCMSTSPPAREPGRPTRWPIRTPRSSPSINSRVSGWVNEPAGLDRVGPGPASGVTFQTAARLR